MSHTPGPWTVDWYNGNIPIAVGVKKILKQDKLGTYSQEICNSILPDTDEDYLKEKDELEANMKLIACAPEMIEQLETILIILDNQLAESAKENESIINVIKQTRLLIEKATT